jgi:hypothetical protein
MFLLPFNSKELEKSPDNKGCHHQIELLGSEDKLWMGAIHQLSQDEEKLFVKYLDTMINDGKIRPSSSTVGSPVIFVPKPNGYGVRLCIDYWHLNDYMKIDLPPLPIMEELPSWVSGVTYITQLM